MEIRAKRARRYRESVFGLTMNFVYFNYKINGINFENKTKE
jgi:hypothetical protein